MNRKSTVFSLCASPRARSMHAEAQQPKKIAMIGYLSGSSLSSSMQITEAFRQGLRALGYVEGQNIVIDYRYAEGKLDLLPELVAELVRLRVDVIVTSGSNPTRAAKKATGTIPIVMARAADPVSEGLV